MKLTLALIAAISLTSCGKKESAPAPAPTKHNVAVVDSGFDIENSVFKANLVDSHRVLCLNTGTNPLRTLAPETRFGELKSGFLAYLSNRSDCVAKKKLNDNISPSFANVQGDFNDWNAAVRKGTIDQSPVREKVQGVLSGENGKYSYHGTATAGLIAENNDKVNLFIVEPDLKQLMLPNEAYDGTGCRTQIEIDIKAKLFEDKDVQKAFTDPNRVDADSVIIQLLKDRGVTMINESYGPASAGEFADYYRKKNCEVPDFKRLFIAESRLSRMRERALEDKFNFRPLHVRAAGNAGQELNLESDTLDPCLDEDNYLIVGSIDAKDKISQFSNRGRCVEVYTLGSQVVVNAPRDFLNVSDGTSFSAPLMTRYLTLNTQPGTTEWTALKSFALNASDSDKFIKVGDWNKDFAYKPKNPQAEPGPNNNNNNNNAGGYQPGWTEEIVTQTIQQCVTASQQNGVAAPQAYCDCAIKGLAKKFSYNVANNMDVSTDPVVQQCRAQHLPPG